MQAGKICYLEIPAKDVEVSSAFYVKLFGWTVRVRGELPYVMVEDIDRTLQAATKLGGEIVTPRTALGPGDAYATLRDPAGNLVGLYQNR